MDSPCYISCSILILQKQAASEDWRRHTHASQHTDTHTDARILRVLNRPVPLSQINKCSQHQVLGMFRPLGSNE